MLLTYSSKNFQGLSYAKFEEKFYFSWKTLHGIIIESIPIHL